MNTQEAIDLLEELKEAHNYTPPYTEALTHAIEHMKRGAPDVVPDGWRLTQKQQIVWDWGASHGLTLLADDCNDLLWKLLLVEEKSK